MCSVNTKFLAVILEAQGGGAFIVINLENVRCAFMLQAAGLPLPPNCPVA